MNIQQALARVVEGGGDVGVGRGDLREGGEVVEHLDDLASERARGAALPTMSEARLGMIGSPMLSCTSRVPGRSRHL